MGGGTTATIKELEDIQSWQVFPPNLIFFSLRFPQNFYFLFIEFFHETLIFSSMSFQNLTFFIEFFHQTFFIGRQECHHECLKVAESVCQYWVWTKNSDDDDVKALETPFKCVLFSDYDQEHSNVQKIFGPRECKIGGGLCSTLHDNDLTRVAALAKKWPL